MTLNYLARHKSTFVYGASLAVLLFLLKWLEWRLLIMDHVFEVYAGIIAVIFTALGIWLALKLAKPKTILVEKQVIIKESEPFVQSQEAVIQIGLSKRELEVLALMADGLSNQEIAAQLFVSLNTIKTHTSKVFEKLEVQRRTQAIEKARRLQLIP